MLKHLHPIPSHLPTYRTNYPQSESIDMLISFREIALPPRLGTSDQLLQANWLAKRKTSFSKVLHKIVCHLQIINLTAELEREKNPSPLENRWSVNLFLDLLWPTHNDIPLFIWN